MTTDLRPLLFEGATWYSQLACPEYDDEPSAWYLAKGDSSAWGGDVLIRMLLPQSALQTRTYFRPTAS